MTRRAGGREVSRLTSLSSRNTSARNSSTHSRIPGDVRSALPATFRTRIAPAATHSAASAGVAPSPGVTSKCGLPYCTQGESLSVAKRSVPSDSFTFSAVRGW